MTEIIKRNKEGFYTIKDKPYISFSDKCYDRLWRILDRNDKLKQILNEE